MAGANRLPRPQRVKTDRHRDGLRDGHQLSVGELGQLAEPFGRDGLEEPAPRQPWRGFSAAADNDDVDGITAGDDSWAEADPDGSAELAHDAAELEEQ